MLEKIEGMVIKEIHFKETSKIIHLFTNKGIISIMCKGAYSLKSKFRVPTLRFSYVEAKIYYKENKISSLVSIDIIDDLKLIKNDIILLSYLNYLTELVVQVSRQTTVNLYNNYINAILRINNGLDPLVITNIIEVKMLDYLGVKLNLDNCIVCGSINDIITIDGDIGGYICKNCYTNELIVNPKTLIMLKKYYYINISSLENIKVSDEVKKEINDFLNIYYERYTGIYLNSKKFLDKLK